MPSRLLGRHVVSRWTRTRRDLMLSVWGANTDVGKSLVSLGLCRAARDLGMECEYVKPVQTGEESDADKVARFVPGISCSTLHSFAKPVSPHVAAAAEGEAVPPSDDELLSGLVSRLEMDGGVLPPAHDQPGSLWVVETAGGVLSPSPSGSLQADLYRPLRLDSILVGDARLGGIGSTLSALESMRLRGYTVRSIAFVGGDEELGNAEFVERETGLRVWRLPAPPPNMEPLDSWAEHAASASELELQRLLEESQDKSNMTRRALQRVWWPFTQHKGLKEDSISVIDSAAGDHFTTLDFQGESSRSRALFDCSASWWTQAIGHGDSELALTSSAAAGRYGHVLFPGCVHEPALGLAEAACNGPGRGWATRTFFSDDGSTAVEVALKMACRLYEKRTGGGARGSKPLCVVAQEDCYHGDTLGAMDVAEPSVFNQGQHPWYEPKGLFLATPRCGWVDGKFQVALPQEMEMEMKLGGGVAAPSSASRVNLGSRGAAFDLESRESSAEYKVYSSYISKKLDDFEEKTGAVLAALMIEPVFTGAGGMYMVDPLFQSLLVRMCRARRMAIVYDEVFTGSYRLGVDSCRKLLGQDPDVACYAKMITGGLIPLSLTLASEEVFRAFEGDSKAEALLHGHSFTAHPMGCAVALHAVEKLSDHTHREMWEENRVSALSASPRVSRSVCLGTVMAVELSNRDGGTGYEAVAESAELASKLRESGGMSVRPLGNVIYVMCTPFTPTCECERILGVLESELLS